MAIELLINAEVLAADSPGIQSYISDDVLQSISTTPATQDARWETPDAAQAAQDAAALAWWEDLGTQVGMTTIPWMENRTNVPLSTAVGPEKDVMPVTTAALNAQDTGINVGNPSNPYQLPYNAPAQTAGTSSQPAAEGVSWPLLAVLAGLIWATS